MTSGDSIVQKLWQELDRFIKLGVEYPAFVEPEDSSPWVVTEDESTARLEYELEKAKKVAQGRGLATAIRIWATPFFASDDAVIDLAMKRYVAARDGEEMPATPGFMGTALMPKDIPAHKRAPVAS